MPSCVYNDTKYFIAPSGFMCRSHFANRCAIISKYFNDSLSLLYFAEILAEAVTKLIRKKRDRKGTTGI
jgi:hypothetical protein